MSLCDFIPVITDIHTHAHIQHRYTNTRTLNPEAVGNG